MPLSELFQKLPAPPVHDAGALPQRALPDAAFQLRRSHMSAHLQGSQWHMQTLNFVIDCTPCRGLMHGLQVIALGQVTCGIAAWSGFSQEARALGMAARVWHMSSSRRYSKYLSTASATSALAGVLTSSRRHALRHLCTASALATSVTYCSSTARSACRCQLVPCAPDSSSALCIKPCCARALTHQAQTADSRLLDPSLPVTPPSLLLALPSVQQPLAAQLAALPPLQCVAAGVRQTLHHPWIPRLPATAEVDDTGRSDICDACELE